MTWVGYSSGGKRDRNSTAGILKPAIRLSTKERKSVFDAQLVMPVVVGICLMEYALRLIYSPL